MKKGLKITLLTLLSIIGLVLVGCGIALGTVFSPKKLTKIVNREAPRFITCDFDLAKADLTFFRTFPKVGIDLHDLTLRNPMHGAPSDTLLHVKHCTAAINIRELLKNNNIVVNNFYLKNGSANLYVNPEGKDNYSVIKTDTTQPSSEFNYAIDLHKVETDNIRVNYTDLSSKITADLHGIDLTAKGKMQDKDIQGKIKLSTEAFDFKTLDSNQLHAKYEQLKINFDGSLAEMSDVAGKLKLGIRQLGLHSGADKYLDSMDVNLASDVQLNLPLQKANLQNTEIVLGDYKLTVDGKAQRNIQDGDIKLDLNYTTEKWPLKEVLAMIPRSIIGEALDDMDLDGKIGLAGKVMGHLNDTQKPLVSADVDWTDGAFAMKDFPLSFQKIKSLFHVDLDLNNKTDVTVKSLDCYTGKNHLTAEGSIKDLFGKMLFDLALTGDLHVPDFQQFLPDALTRCNAEAKAAINVKCDFEQLSNMAVDQWEADGNIVFTDVDVVYADSLNITSPSMTVGIRFPVEEHPYNIGEWAFVSLQAEKLNGSKIGLGDLEAVSPVIEAYINNIMDSTQALRFGADYEFGEVTGKMDTIDAYLYKPNGTFVMRDTDEISMKYTGEVLVAKVGKMLSAQVGAMALSASSHYKENESNMLMRWNPDVKITLNKGNVNLNGLEIPIEVPQLQAALTTHQCDIGKGSVILGKSDFSITGKVSNMDQYFQGSDLMTGDLELNSNYIDINEIMDLVSGFGAPDSVLAEQPEASQKDPFMVPYGMDIRMHTNIKKALFEDAEIRNVGGYISLKDGVLVLDEMGLTSDAARLQLTALYKSPRKNHLFLGLDFHLLDIQIDKLIQMIPEVDTVLPMLKSFAGNAEFHFAIETYLKSNYDLKYSTLRGAAAINGKDLVVLDEETFIKISKLLQFKKGTTNRIDSLSAEATIFKNEVDVYPFSVSIDKYQAILSGRHNLDWTYNYNISLVKPVRIGLDIIGTDKRKFKVGKPKYATMFNPERKKVVEQNVLELKQQINNALKANVKPQNAE